MNDSTTPARVRRSATLRAPLGLGALSALVLVGLGAAPAGGAAQAAGCALVPANLVSWWPGEGTAVDVRGGADGTLDNGVAFAPGLVGQAFSFDGYDDVVRVQNVANLEVLQFTIDAWASARSAGTYGDVLGGNIVTKDIGNTYTAPYLSWDIVGPGSTGQFFAHMGFTDGNDAWAASGGGFAFNVFHHVAVSWDGSVLNLYVDGQLEGTTTVGPKTVAYSGEPMTIGQDNLMPAAWRAFDGLIDEVEFYNRALGGAEIKAVYDAGAAGKCLATTVTIDIHPGSLPNSINPKSKGTIPVAILSTASFDAPNQVDRGSLTFGRTGSEASLAFCSPGAADVNGDARLDLICHFKTQLTGFRAGDTQGVLKGSALGGTPITGTDSVRIVP